MSMSAFLTLTVIKQVSVALRPKDIQNFKKYRQKNRLDTKAM